MHSSFAASAGEVLMASFGGMTEASTNKLREISRKVTFVRLLDASTISSDGGGDWSDNINAADNKESSSSKMNAARKSAVLSERSNNSSNTVAGGAIPRANRGALEALRDLRDLASIVSEIERRASTMREAIESLRRDNSTRRDMSEAARRQTAQLAATLSALPEHLPHEAPSTPPPPTAATGAEPTTFAAGSGPSSTCPRGNAPAVVAAGEAPGRVAAPNVPEVPVVELVTVGELQGVPRSTRGRLTIEQVNSAVAEIQKAVERRHNFLSRPRKNMSENQRGRLEEILKQKVPAHAGDPFLAESDLRALPAFKKGEVTVKALIATLRNLKRLKGVRGGGTMTYVVQGG